MLSLYLVRHAHAEPRGPRWPDDAVRPLTASGRRRFSTLLLKPAVRRAGIELVLTSGLDRATETAAMLAASCRTRPPVRLCRALEPGHDPDDVVRALRRRPGAGRLALVGHEPDLSRLFTHLTGQGPPVAFRKGGVWRLRVRTPVIAGSGRLVWARWPGPAAVRVAIPS
ncbi:MAG: histidine phosphatase family protein [Vicinamibacterales bacterium]